MTGARGPYNLGGSATRPITPPLLSAIETWPPWPHSTLTERTRGESGHPGASVWSCTFVSFSFSKSTTALPLLPTC
jgi:hypothetical protein